MLSSGYINRLLLWGQHGNYRFLFAFVPAAGQVFGKPYKVCRIYPGEGGISLSLGTNVAVKLRVGEMAERPANFMVGGLLSACIVFAGLLIYLPIRGRAKPNDEKRII